MRMICLIIDIEVRGTRNKSLHWIVNISSQLYRSCKSDGIIKQWELERVRVRKLPAPSRIVKGAMADKSKDQPANSAGVQDSTKGGFSTLLDNEENFEPCNTRVRLHRPKERTHRSSVKVSGRPGDTETGKLQSSEEQLCIFRKLPFQHQRRIYATREYNSKFVLFYRI